MIRQTIVISTFLFILTSTPIFSQSDQITIPFRIFGKMIVVQGSINGQVGNIVIDTGIPKMLINQRFFTNLDLFSTGASAGFQSVNGETGNAAMAMVVLEIQDFSVNGAADVIDLQAIERQKRMNILGIVGINLFRKYELEIDYLSEEIRLYRLDRKGQRRLQQPQALPSEVLAFDYYQHLPYITTYLHGMALHLGLDTGAEKTVLSASVYEKIKHQIRDVKTQKMIDLHGQPTNAIAAQVDGLEVGALEISSLPAIFIPLNTHYGGLDEKEIQGLLGHDFLRHFRLSINFKKRKVYLWNAQQNANMPSVIRKN